MTGENLDVAGCETDTVSLIGVDNVVFDIGGVLLEFIPRRIMSRLVRGERGERLYRVLFEGRHLWGKFDVGREDNLSVALEAAMEAGVPGGERDILRVLEQFVDQMTRMPMSYTFDELHAAGKKIYLLTNYPTPSFERTLERFPFLDKADGRVVSAHERLAKPDPAIFTLLIDRFKIDPRKSLFIDDNRPNVLSAADLGFKTLLYRESDGIFESFSCLGNKAVPMNVY